MSDLPDHLPKVQPFVESRPNHKPSTRGLLSLVTFIVSLGSLTVALGGGGKLVLDVFNTGLASSLNGIWAKVLALGLAYLCGWAVALLSIRAFCNLILPIFIKAFAWLTLVGIAVLYIKIIQKLYMQVYDATHYWAYLGMMLGGLVALVGLHLVLDDHDLRPFAIPLLLLGMVQMFAIVYRYVFTADANAGKFIGDLFFFLVMTGISALMLAHLGMLGSLRRGIDSLFLKSNGVPAR
jgi:hypothetical protein